MPTQSPPKEAPEDVLAYAESLYVHAAERLDPFSLRCWIIQRLMLDEGLEHECAERAFEHVLDAARRAEDARSARALERQRRRAAIRALGRSAYGLTSRRLSIRRAGDPACV